MKVAQSCLTLCDPMDCIVHGILQARILEWVPFPSPEDLPNPGIEPRFPALWVDSLPAEPQRKPNNTGMGSPSLLQQIFPTQESNQGLLHCRWILYQLSYQGSPKRCQPYFFKKSLWKLKLTPLGYRGEDPCRGPRWSQSWQGVCGMGWGTQRPKTISPMAIPTCPSSASGNGLPRQAVPLSLFPALWASGAALSS